MRCRSLPAWMTAPRRHWPGRTRWSGRTWMSGSAGCCWRLGRGGISKIARATGASRQTVHTGLAELEGRVELAGRVRRPGGGRKRRRDLDPGLVPTLEALVDPDTRGDPESPLRWTCKSTRELAEALTAAGHPVSDDTVG